jgi:hypothetical protein
MCFWQIKNSFKGLHYPVKQKKYDTNISKLYGVYKHIEENDKVHHIKKGKGNK